MASTFAEKNQEFAKSTKDNGAQSGSKKKQSPFQGMYYGAWSFQLRGTKLVQL